ncbi:MAG TPA: dihydrofolate reductase family protein [Thermoplasmata archaeon]|nr:dihydrofolate reductase family protein [Thermoplasmata archaeon]
MTWPHVLVNFAMSVDGKIALPTRKQTRISDEEDLRRVHQLRATCDAVLVGVGTILADDPKLTVKPEYATGRNPLRVVLDSEGRTPEDAHVLNRDAPTLVVTTVDSFRVEMEAEKAPEIPKVFTRIHMRYVLRGNIKEASVKRAIDLSMEKYCSASIMLKRGGVDITTSYTIERSATAR